MLRGRLAVLLVAVVALFAWPVAALAQDPPPEDPVETVDPDTPVSDDDPGDDVLDPDEIPPDPDDGTEPGDDEGCVPGPDGDYAYCEPCPEDGTPDGDYAYCVPQPAGGGGPTQEDDPPPAPRGEVRRVAAGQLPYTGSEPLLLALIGLGFLLTGTGTRLLLRPGRPRPPA